MRTLILAALVLTVFLSCNKSKYTSTPQITFKSITASFHSSTTLPPDQGPKLTIQVTDAEGDLGFVDFKDSSYIYVKNITVPPYKSDSFKFPAALTGHKNFKANVDVALEGDATHGGVLDRTCASGCTDTLYFEVYVKDFAKNKSNVIRTDKPLLFISP